MQKLPINPFLDFYATPDAMIINPFVFGGGAFDPLTLSPALWLSDTGADASTWPDLSGNGRDATQATAGNRPAIISTALNGRQVRRFDGSNDFLECSSVYNLANFTVFCVAKTSVNNANPKTIYNSGTSGIDFSRDCLVYLDNANANLQRSNGSSYPTSTTSLGVNSFGLITSSFDGSALSISVNAAAPASTSTTISGSSADTVTIGTTREGAAYGFYHDGDIAEILVLPYAATPQQRQDVENYLNAKYNIY